MRFCPGCAQLIHFERDTPLQRCWNCGTTTDFSRFKTPQQKLLLWLGSHLERTLPDCSRRSGAGRVALLAGVPAAVIMLLICNSLHITIVHNPTAPFSWP